MIDSAKCRARANEWAAKAEKAMEGPFKSRLERIARNWTALGAALATEEAREAHRRRGGR